MYKCDVNLFWHRLGTKHMNTQSYSSVYLDWNCLLTWFIAPFPGPLWLLTFTWAPLIMSCKIVMAIRETWSNASYEMWISYKPFAYIVAVVSGNGRKSNWHWAQSLLDLQCLWTKTTMIVRISYILPRPNVQYTWNIPGTIPSAMNWAVTSFYDNFFAVLR